MSVRYLWPGTHSQVKEKLVFNVLKEPNPGGEMQ